MNFGQDTFEPNQKPARPPRAGVLRALLVFLVLICANWNQPGSASEPAWQALRDGGAVAVMRHAQAPGTGDPPGFRLGNCSTQRNLSSEGREQARQIGAQFKANNIFIEQVLSSEWCRCLDTARLAFGDHVEPLPILNSFFSNRDAGGMQTRAVRELVEGWRAHSGVLVLVTHQVNITALTGVYPAEGEILVLKPRATAGFGLVTRFRP
jgi:phosphohistidine phosphatase SixA